MAKIQPTIRTVWWRGYQAVASPDSIELATRRTARGTERIPRMPETDDVRPRRLAHVPRRRLEILAWRHASAEEREASRDDTRKLLIRRAARGDLADKAVLLDVQDCTDAELMMKLPIDVLASIAYDDDLDCRNDCESDDRSRACG